MKSPQSNRIDSFDILRGYFLFVIIIDHLMRYFGFWEIFTGRGAQWVSAAEGFFFVSGIMIGLVRGRRMETKPFPEVLRKCWKRALQLYLWAIGLTIFFSVFAVILAGSAGLKPGFFEGSLSDFLSRTLSLYYSYGWADFLTFYSVYIFFTPFAIWLLRKKLWHTVLLLSLIVWTQTSTMMGGWQIIFFSGVVVGYYKDQIEGYFRGLTRSLRSWLCLFVYTVAGLSLALSVFFTTIAEEYGTRGSGLLLGMNLEPAANYSINTLRPIFDKTSMEPARLILFYFWFTALYLIVKKFETPIKERLGWFLITLGRNSLYVYIVSAILLFFFNIFVPGQQIWPVNILINTGFVALVWYMTKKEFLFRLIPR